MPGYWNAHSDLDFEDQGREPPEDGDDLIDEIFGCARSATAALYPEARIPETAMPMIDVNAERIVTLIIADLTDRGGLQEAWEAIDNETQAEIRETWKRIILAEAHQ